MLKNLSRLSSGRDIYIITKEAPEQYSNSKIKINEIGEEIRLLKEYENFDSFWWYFRFIE